MKIRHLLLSTSFFVAACTGGGFLNGPRPPVSKGAHSENDSTGMQALMRVGDLPSTDSPALAIQCNDEQTCWINSPKILWRSTDGGKSWHELYRVAGDEEILSYDFVDTNVGWGVSFHGLSRTEDGGHTWLPQVTPFQYPNGESRSLWFLRGGRVGWLAGGVYRSQTNEELNNGVPNDAKDVTGKRVLEEAIFRTSDGGHTWNRQSLFSKLTGRILRIRFFDENLGMALGERNVYYTNDGGANWHRGLFNKKCVKPHYLGEYYDARPDNVEMLDSSLWWVSYSDGRVIKTVDGGRSWCDLTDAGSIPFDKAGQSFFTAIHFNNSEQGWGLGWDRFLYETKNAGSTWARIPLDLGVYGIAFPDRSHGFLISDKGVYRLHSTD